MNKYRIKKLQLLEFKQNFKMTQNDIKDFRNVQKKDKIPNKRQDLNYLKQIEPNTFKEWKIKEQKIKEEYKELFDSVKEQQNPTFFFANLESRQAPTHVYILQNQKKNPNLFQSRFQFNKPKCKTLLKNLKKASKQYDKYIEQFKKTLFKQFTKTIESIKRYI